MIDGMRFAFTGHADGSIGMGIAVLVVVDIALWVWAYSLFRSGYKLKA